MDDLCWIVRGQTLGLTGTTREAYLERRRRHGNEPLTSALQSDTMPPYTQEFWERVYESQVVSREALVFEARLLEDGECVGEVSLRGLSWPDASCELGISVWSPEARAQGYGEEAGMLAAAYAFDALGVHRLWMRFLASNPAVAHLAKRIPGREVGRLRESAWAFGQHQDEIIFDCLRSEWPPHPATKAFRGEA